MRLLLRLGAGCIALLGLTGLIAPTLIANSVGLPLDLDPALTLWNTRVSAALLKFPSMPASAAKRNSVTAWALWIPNDASESVKRLAMKPTRSFLREVEPFINFLFS